MKDSIGDNLFAKSRWGGIIIGLILFIIHMPHNREAPSDVPRAQQENTKVESIIDQDALRKVAGKLERRKDGSTSYGADLSVEKFDWSGVPSDAIFTVTQEHFSRLKNLDNVRLVELSDTYRAAVLIDPTRPGSFDDQISDYITGNFGTRHETIVRPVIEYHNLRFHLPQQFNFQLSDLENGPATNASFCYNSSGTWGFSEKVYSKNTMSKEEKEIFRTEREYSAPDYYEDRIIDYREIEAPTPDDAYELAMVLRKIRNFNREISLKVKKDEHGSWIITAAKKDPNEYVDGEWRQNLPWIHLEALGKTSDEAISEYKKLIVLPSEVAEEEGQK